MKVPEQYRVRNGRLASDESFGNNGCFIVSGPQGAKLLVIASDQLGWDHVSVSTKTRCPRWDEMCFIKDLFFDEDETVVQFHPKKSEYVNNHPHCLHLWKMHNHEYELPDSIFVGVKSIGEVTL